MCNVNLDSLNKSVTTKLHAVKNEMNELVLFKIRLDGSDRMHNTQSSLDTRMGFPMAIIFKREEELREEERETLDVMRARLV